MRVLVTGGAGFLGSTLVDRMLAEGYSVDVVDDLSSGSLANLAEGRARRHGDLTIHRLDVRSPDVVEVMARRRPDIVVHLAARPTTSTDVVADAEVTVVGTVRVLEAARRCGVAKVVVALSSGIYGTVAPRALPVRESHPQVPLTARGVADKAVGDYLVAYREQHSLEFTALILGDVYGPRQPRCAGLVGPVAAAFVDGRPATLFGGGAATADLVYVDDAVDALARAATRGSGLLMNVGTGIETPLSALHAHLANALGVGGVSARTGPLPDGRPLRLSLDPARAGLHLGWTPWTTVAEGVAATVRSLPEPPGRPAGPAPD